MEFDGVEGLFQAFQEQAKTVTDGLSQILREIREGKIPSAEERTKNDSRLDELEKRYRAIEKTAGEILPENEMPGRNAAVAEYQDAINSSRWVQYVKNADACKKTLEKFLSIASDVSCYLEALRPFQEKSRELLEELEAVKGDTAELPLPDVSSEKLLVDAVAQKEQTAPNFDRLGKIVESYGLEVETGVVTHSYYFGPENAPHEDSRTEDADKPLETISQDAGEPKAEEPEAEEPKTSAAAMGEADGHLPDRGEKKEGDEETSSDQTAGENTSESNADQEASDDEDGAEEPDPGDFEASGREESDCQKKFQDGGILAEPGHDFGSLQIDVSMAASKSASAKVFIKDIHRVQRERAVLILLNNEGFIDRDLVCDTFHATSDTADLILSELKKRGYLVQYTLTPGGTFYSGSQKLYKSLSQKSAAAEIARTPKTVNKWVAAETPAEALARFAMIRICDSEIQTLNSRLIDNINKDVGKRYFISSNSYKSDKNVLIMGAFLEDTGEAESAMQCYLQHCEYYHHYAAAVFASYSLEKADALAELLLAEKPEGCAIDRVFLCASPAGTYYSMDDHTERDAEYLWKSLDDPAGDDPDDWDLDDGHDDAADDDDSADETEQADGREDEKRKDAPVSVQEKEKPQVTAQKIPAQPGSGQERNIDVPSAADEDQKSGKLQKEKKHEIPSGSSPASCTADSSSAPKTAGKADIDAICEMISKNRPSCAVAYAHALSIKNSAYSRIYQLLSYAYSAPDMHCIYSTDNVFDLIPEMQSSLSCALVACIGLRTFFSNQVPHDHRIESLYSIISSYDIVNRNSSFSDVIYKIQNFRRKYQKGMDAYAGYRTLDQSRLDQELDRIRREASDFYNHYVLGHKKEKASMRRFTETEKLIFNPNSDMGSSISSVTQDRFEEEPLVEDYLKANFFDKETEILPESVSDERISSYISEYWMQAGKLMGTRLHEHLIGSLSNNLTNNTRKAVEMLARWCCLAKMKSSQLEDDGQRAYRSTYRELLRQITEALNEISSKEKNQKNLQERASYSVVRQNLEELQRCVEGVYDENEKKYFYTDFLLSSELFLNDDFYPDLTSYSTDLEKLQPETRILNFARRDKLPTYEEQLNRILDGEKTDENYGNAIRIIQYLSAVESADKYKGYAEQIESGKKYVSSSSDIDYTNFIGELELAQSYGQMVNTSDEFRKERIMGAVGEWNEWARSTLNFGFFHTVMNDYLDEIHSEAKIRETALEEQVKIASASEIRNISAEIRDKRIGKIRDSIREQNYTVAEDLLAHIDSPEEDSIYEDRENFLEDFLDNYPNYLSPVSDISKTFESQVRLRNAHNRAERGGEKLASSFLNGGKMKAERLQQLLISLGFHVDQRDCIREGDMIGKYQNFIVTTAPEKNGRRENYTHPIAPFGSAACKDGFRVVCVNGNYDADELIDVMKNIGTAKHTIILLDSALRLSERRRLARKCRTEMNTRIFAVLDRVVMYYLVRNYDGNKVNRMLMALTIPFAYYQPYVAESADKIPPEMFIGRKDELKKIEDPHGVNLVYGGRQLGKTALLRKAQEDIDQDENGDRSIYIEIKGQNYREAARTIGQTLYDDKLLEEDPDTEDWRELTRAIRNRLNDEKNRIPYFLLLLDEADRFIETSEAIGFQPFDALKELQTSLNSSDFKFVIAGLRDVVRFKKKAALSNNSVLAHLDSLTVKPFRPNEARELMEMPLGYLGLEFPKEKEYLVTLILASTNYFPGLIQLYCKKLLECMTDKSYAGYNEADTPIYEVSENHIKRVLSDEAFMKQIQEKYYITLTMGNDDYYYLIALLMAYLCHTEGFGNGYSASDIRRIASDFQLGKISSLDEDKISALMEELRELYVLRSTGNGHYLFTRTTFYQMMGTQKEVEDDLLKKLEEEQN